MSILLREYEFELIGDLPNPNYAAMVVGPHEGECRVRYRKRKSSLT
jgi:sterol 14-demethylase